MGNELLFESLTLVVSTASQTQPLGLPVHL